MNASEHKYVQVLRTHFPVGNYGVFHDFRCTDDNGDNLTIADVVVVPFYRTRALIQGFEVKDRRSDWLMEIKYRKTKETIRDCCHCWWILTDSEATVHPDELRDGWGLMLLKD